MTLPLLLLAGAVLPMLAEARLAARHDRVLRRRGAAEPASDVYRIMQVAYPACFLAMAIEAWGRHASVDGMFLAGAVVFAVAKALKYWAMVTLGERWTFRVLVPPGSSRIVRGPYRWLRHPNYVAVAGELAGFAVMAQAGVTGVIALIFFVLLMLARIRVEEDALGLRPGME
jgi:methyltransferase